MKESRLTRLLGDIKEELKKPLPEPLINQPKEKRKMAKKKSAAADEAPAKTKSKKKTAVKEAPAKSKAKSDDNEGYITIQDLAKEAGIEAQTARVKLRDSETTVERDGSRWRWKDGSKGLKAARKVLGLS